MSKYGLLVTSPVGPDKNIGDYIQSLAAFQFLPKDAEYEYIEKESVSEYESDTCVKCIMNAWYIWHPENWPPKEYSIKPLLTSIHITPLTADEMLKNGGKEYFIKYGPVGCRDTGTSDILNKNGIPSYFSACLTLTLGKTYSYEGQREGYAFVDPYFPPFRYVSGKIKKYYPINLIKAILYYVHNPNKITRMSKIPFFKGRIGLQTLYNASIFYHAYSKFFDDSILFNAEYISHMVPVRETTSNDELMATAEDLVKKYSKKKMVVTSRIHCALPCLGLETPVIFVCDKMMNSDKNIFNAPGRFGGLIDFFRVATLRKDRVCPIDEQLKLLGKINLSSSFENKSVYLGYREALIKQCVSFIKDDK